MRNICARTNLFVFVVLFFAFIASANRDACKDLARDSETLIVFSTLGGGLTAVDPVTSETRWTISDEPAVKTESQPNLSQPQFLPDPRDGSIYQLGNMGDLKKMPYTIPELVANAPCRSSDGILYSGKKSDTWFMIDPKTGQREHVISFGKMSDQRNDNIGWGKSRSIYVGRTQYTVIMYDSVSKNKNMKPWNITFYDYASHSMAPEVSSEYEYIHLAASSSGLIATLDRKEGKLKYQKELTSPVVAVFLLGLEGLLAVPFTTLSDEALQSILENSSQGNINELKLFQSLYIGDTENGLYALPSFADTNTAIISSKTIKLLEGDTSNSDKKIIHLNDILNANNNAIVLGHYEIPRRIDSSLEIFDSNIKSIDDKRLTTTLNDPQNVQTDQNDNLAKNDENNILSEETFLNKQGIKKFINDSKSWFLDHPSGSTHQLLTILVLIMFAMAWYTYSSFRELKLHSQNGFEKLSRTRTSKTDSNFQNVEDNYKVENGKIRVGKITFDPLDILGKGCEGTFVFRGEFDERLVAVKRLLPECFSFADREVSLLRESDAHENVIRYFCTEQDRQFRYIAVELCSATLQDYIEGSRCEDLQQQIGVWDILFQSISGLIHLHSLNIVHRDIKPQNILISLPDANKNVKILISDFGLCKKLRYGEFSYRGQSGITGTDGWIAHEIIQNGRRTSAVDIFSMGCVYYYVLTKGHHPFGGILERQGNIISGLKDLTKLVENKCSKMILSEQLIADMIHKKPEQRPTAMAVSNHPIFWHQNRILAFLQDASDRVEKLQYDTDPLLTLEKNSHFIVNGNWNTHLDEVITQDLRKYRGYNGGSVRDLLRAFRNKKHHYHELTIEAQQVLGSIPQDFTSYWISKFPHLFSHTYHSLSACSLENAFKAYYNKDYSFTKPEYFLREESNFERPHAHSKLLQEDGNSKKTINRKGYYNFQNSSPAGEQKIANGKKKGSYANFQFKNRNRPKTNYDDKKDFTWILQPKNDDTNTHY